MSRGEIVEHLGEALYRVRLKYAVAQVKAQLGRISARIAELAVEVPGQKLAMLQLRSEADAIKASINSEITSYQQNAEGALEELKRLQVILIRKFGEINKLQYTLDLLVSENLSLLKRRGQIEAIPEDKLIDAWCADFTEDLEGDVGLIDLNDEGSYGAIIQPGYSEEAAYNGSRDGALMPREAQSSRQVFLNAALLPGVQKFRPRYRVGTISNIVNDTCTVFLDAAASSAQALNINNFDFYADVPIMYMDCNADVFEEDDKVLVRFTESGPLVVGFESEPRQCDAGDFAFIPAQYNDGALTTFGLPEVPADPLGTPGGADPSWFYRQDRSDNWIFKKYSPAAYGAQDWESAEGLIISWSGLPGRLHSSSTTTPNTLGMFFRGGQVYCNGKEVADVGFIVGGADVYGAAVHDETLTVIALSTLTWNVIQYPWQGRSTSGPGAVVDSFAKEFDYVIGSGWHFNQRGDEAVLTLRQDGEKMAKRRYVLGSGIQPTEVIWERGNEGTGTASSTPVTDTTVYEESRLLWGQHQIPIYVDFIGNSEVTLYIRHRERDILATLNTNTDIYNYYDKQDATDFVLSTGEVLATIGPTYNRTLFFTSDEFASPATMTYEDKINVRFAPSESFYVDIRRKAIAFDVIENEYSAYFSGSPDGNGMVSGLADDTGRRVYEMHVKGAKIISIVMQEYASQNTERQYEPVPDALGGSVGDLLGPEAPVTSIGKFTNVGYVEAKNQSLASMFVRWPAPLSVDFQEETAGENQITGYANPDLQLFDGRDGITMYALGRI